MTTIASGFGHGRVDDGGGVLRAKGLTLVARKMVWPRKPLLVAPKRDVDGENFRLHVRRGSLSKTRSGRGRRHRGQIYLRYRGTRSSKRRIISLMTSTNNSSTMSLPCFMTSHSSSRDRRERRQQKCLFVNRKILKIRRLQQTSSEIECTLAEGAPMFCPRAGWGG